MLRYKNKERKGEKITACSVTTKENQKRRIECVIYIMYVWKSTADNKKEKKKKEKNERAKSSAPRVN